MSLQNTRIALGTVPPKGRMTGGFAFAPLTKTIPGQVRKYVKDGVYVEEAQDPENEGEVLIFALAGAQQGTMFVAVESDGLLYWVPVFSRQGIVDNATGRPWDPLSRL